MSSRMGFSHTSSVDISDSTHPLTDDALPQVDYLHPDITSKYFVHFTSKKDTLQGLALFYNTNVESIKKANKLLSDYFIQAKRYILIPKIPANLYLEQAIGTVIYPDMEEPPDHPSITTIQTDVDDIPSLTNPVESFQWNGITPIDKPQGHVATSDSYIHRIESTILRWYTNPSDQSKQKSD